MSKLTEKDLILILREEYEKQLFHLDESLKTFMKTKDDGEKKGVVGIDTKIRHKGSKLLYTVHEIGSDDVILRTPEGDTFSVSSSEFEEEYEID